MDPQDINKYNMIKSLVVDDDTISRILHPRYLQRVGIVNHKVASNGKEAVDLVNSVGVEYFDVIFMDIDMPDMNGIETPQVILTMEVDSSNVSRAEELKVQANEAFKVHKYNQAIDLYTQAIELNAQNAVYWANRAFAHTKLEEYGSSIEDASKAIEIDPKYSKACSDTKASTNPGYYRRGAAYLALGKYKQALKDFQQVKKISPKDPDAAKKLKECEKAVQKLKFEEAIAAPEAERRSVAESIDFRSIGTGPRSSSLPTQVVVVAVAVIAAAVMWAGNAKLSWVVAVPMVMLVVLKPHLWGGWSSGLFTGRHVLDLGLSIELIEAR
ncbi:Serine/threonine-protein phosphatase 5 [Linum grandiflorum]